MENGHIAMENGPGLKMYFLLKMVIFHHYYVSLPEGTSSNAWFSIVMSVYWRVVIFVDENLEP